MNFKQWLEGGGGFIYGSMADPATDQNDHPPLGSELTADPNMSLGGDDLPPTKKNRKKERRKPKFASFGGIRKEIPSKLF
jgi:hypothetical protein